MASTDVKKWLTLTANVGVLLGLALVAYELRQNSDLMRIQINQSRADAAMMSNQQMFESAYIPQILIQIREGNELSDEEMLRYVAWFRGINRNQDNVLSQYFSGMLGEHTLRSIEDFARDAVDASDYSREAWRLTKIGYSDQYIQFVEDAISGNTGE
jgi:hypothetical protein